MEEISVKFRKDYMLTLFEKLSEIELKLSEKKDYLSNHYMESYDIIIKKELEMYKDKIEKFNSNILIISNFQNDITNLVNEWNKFIHSEKEQSSFFYPIKYHKKLFELKKQIKLYNLKIYNLSIENRMIKETLHNIDDEIEKKVEDQFKVSNPYSDFQCLIEEKKTTISNIVYLIQSIYINKSISLDFSNIEKCKEFISLDF